MKILVACECSGAVRRAFRELGHDAYSCDLKPSADNSGFHLQGDCRIWLTPPAIDEWKWDMMVAFPDCTYLAVSGLHWNKKTPGRAKKTEKSLDFVRFLMGVDIRKIAIENPVGCISTKIKPATQYIQPYDFGEDASKKTGLWLKGLPPLTPTKRVAGRIVTDPKTGKQVERWSNQTDSGQNRLGPSDTRAAERAVTYAGVASAMAEQWG